MDTPSETKSQPVQPGTSEFPSSSGKSFNGYFGDNKRWNFRKHDLIDTRARRLFETTAFACENDAYPALDLARSLLPDIARTQGVAAAAVLRSGHCGAMGVVTWEENARPQPGGMQRSLVELHGDFHSELGRSPSGDPLIVCNACDTIQPD